MADNFPDGRVFEAVFASSDNTSNFNWKLNIEATLEGYHIKPTHPESFYPYGFDNLTVTQLCALDPSATIESVQAEVLDKLLAQLRRVAAPG